MRSLTSWCLVEELRPKIRRYHGIPTLPSRSWTMIVVGVSSAGKLSAEVVGFSSPPSWGASDCALASKGASPDEAGGSDWAAPDVESLRSAPSGASAAKDAGMLTVVMARAPTVASTSAEIFRWDIYGSLG